MDVLFTVHFESSSNVAVERCEHLPRKPLQDGQNVHQFINRKKSVTTSNHTGLVLFMAIYQIFVHIDIYMTYYVFRCNNIHSLSLGKENLSYILKAHSHVLTTSYNWILTQVPCAVEVHDKETKTEKATNNDSIKTLVNVIVLSVLPTGIHALLSLCSPIFKLYFNS